MKSPELLLPAGGLERMRTAFDFGADAVYAGSPRYSLRARNNEFAKLDVLQQGITEAHQRGKKFFLTVNTLPHNSKLKTFHADMQPLIEMKPDALIMADPGLIMQVREKYPEMPIHLSVQANTTNYWGVQFWQKIGVERIILSRELSLEEIAEIRQQCPDIELEVFVHGALCIAYSGRCLLSGYFNHRDPNQGTCTNSCRWDYKVHKAQEDEMGDAKLLDGFNFNAAQEEANAAFESINGQQRHPQADKVFLIEEANRPKELMPIMEDEHGTYIMNSKDLRAIEQVAKLAQIGVDSLKVEGRTKSVYYVARVAQAYRKAIDDAVAGKPFDYSLLAELEGLANRGYTSGFLERHQTQDYQNYLYGHSIAKQSQFVGQIIHVDNKGWATIDVKNKFSVGDLLEIIHPKGNQLIKLEQMQQKGATIGVAPGNGIQVQIPNMKGREKALVARVIQNGNTAQSAPDTTPMPQDGQPLNTASIPPEPVSSHQPNAHKEKAVMSNINNTLGFIMNLDGARAVSLVDANTGLMLGAQGGTGIDLEYASAANSELYHAKLKIMKSLGIQSELEDFLITLSDQYHLLVPLLHHEGVFLYFVLDKKRATLSLARHRLKECAAQLVLE